MLLAPVVKERKGEHVKLLQELQARASCAPGSMARWWNWTVRHRWTCAASIR
jgi:Excinuclease ABC subunit A